MRLYTLSSFVRTALRSLWRNSWMTVASVGSVVVGLLIFGIFMVAVWNLNHLAAQVESQVEITVFLQGSISSDDISGLEQSIRNIPGVLEVQFVSRDEALLRLEERFGADSELLAGLREDNPLWDTFEVRVEDAQLVSTIASTISQLTYVDDVQYGREWVEDMLKVTRLLRLAGLVLMAGLALASTFIIANTIRITVFARRREITIMKFVGATDWFIRWPFVIEGWLLGVIGAALASAIIYVGYTQVAVWLAANVPFIGLLSPQEIIRELLVLLFAIGSLLGICGSTISLRRFLRV